MVGKQRSPGRSKLLVGDRLPGAWMARDFYRCVCLLRGRGGLGFLLGRKENSLAPYRVLVRGPICFPSSLVFIFGSEVGLPAETGLPSPVEPSPPVTPSLSPPTLFPCGLTPSWARDQLSLTQEQGWSHQTRTSLFSPWNQAMEGQEIIGI